VYKAYILMMCSTGLTAALILLAIVVLIFLQVLFRYVINQPLSWTVELSRFLFAWVSMIGAAAATPEIFDQGMDLLVRKLSEKTQVVVDAAARIFTALTVSALIIYAVDLVGRVHSQISSVLRIRMSFVYAAIPAGLILFLVIFSLDSLILYKKAERSVGESFISKLKRVAGE
jgi:TRAP-type C4-dicarboxylate transport system permease small subunit